MPFGAIISLISILIFPCPPPAAWFLFFALSIYSLQSFADVLQLSDMTVHSVRDREGPLKFASLKSVIIMMVMMTMKFQILFQIYALAKVLSKPTSSHFQDEKKSCGGFACEGLCVL